MMPIRRAAIEYHGAIYVGTFNPETGIITGKRDLPDGGQLVLTAQAQCSMGAGPILKLVDLPDTPLMRLAKRLKRALQR